MDAWLSSAAARRAALSRVWMEGRLGRGMVVGCGSVRSMERCWVVGHVWRVRTCVGLGALSFSGADGGAARGRERGMGVCVIE